MASHVRQPCVKCSKVLGHIICGGCQQWMCKEHFHEHQQQIEQMMDHVVQEHDEMRQHMMSEEGETAAHLLSLVDAWEKRSIETIRRVADDTRTEIRQKSLESKIEVLKSLESIGKELKEKHQTNDYTEIELNAWLERIKSLKQELNKSFDLDVLYADEELSNRIRFIQLRRQMKSIASMSPSSCNMGLRVAGDVREGRNLYQLAHPYAIDIDRHGTLYIADHLNSRVIAWKQQETAGQLVVDNVKATALLVDSSGNNLWISDQRSRQVIRWLLRQRKSEILVTDLRCMGLAMDDDQNIYVSDHTGHQVRRYRPDGTTGTIVAGGHGQGEQLNQLNFPWGIFVDEKDAVYVSDYRNHRVMKWPIGAREGLVVAGGHGPGTGLDQLCEPQGLYVDQRRSIYVVDSGNRRIMCWPKDAQQGVIVVGGMDQNIGAHQLLSPIDLCLDRIGNMYVADYRNHCVQKFQI